MMNHCSASQLFFHRRRLTSVRSDMALQRRKQSSVGWLFHAISGWCSIMVNIWLLFDSGYYMVYIWLIVVTINGYYMVHDG